MNTRQKAVYFILTAFIFATIGFFTGRAYAPVEKEVVTITKYIKGETITDTIEKPEPYAVYRPVDTGNIIQNCVLNGYYTELFPEKTIVEYVELTNEDTLAIIRDWGSKKMYSETLFDNDTIGKLDVNAEVQYNRLNLLTYSYSPIIKVSNTSEEMVKTKLFSPFLGIGAGMSITPDYRDLMLNINAGAFIKEKYGINLQYNRSWDNNANYLGGGFIFKF